MENDVFDFIDMRARSIRRDAEQLLPQFRLLGACHSFETMPEATIRLAASRLREAANYLDEMADRAKDARKPRIVEAAE